jgi:hypothetical protein
MLDDRGGHAEPVIGRAFARPGGFAHPTICRDCLYDHRERSKETAMGFWIECTRFETGQPIHINIALVGGVSRDAGRAFANRAIKFALP